MTETANPKPLIFDPGAHRYVLRGADVPSVTNILQGMGLYPPYPEDPVYRKRGSAVHAACKLSLEGRLNRDLTSPIVRLYIKSFEGFLQASGFRPNLIEHPVWSDHWRCAGTLDLHGELKAPTLVDIKTGEPPAAARLQTAAYALMLKESQGIETARRFTVRLFQDGSPGRPEEHHDMARDMRNFLSAVSVWHLRKEFGIRERK